MEKQPSIFIYFTKYIPVEGEINIGDTYSCPHKGHALNLPGKPLAHEPKTIICTHKIGEGMLCKDCYKIKLFLCSRDIKVGDKVYAPNYKSGTDILEEEQPDPWYVLENLYDVKNFQNQSSFKVIGEISPDALGYVKEGMEYNREDIKPFYLLAGGECEYLEGHDPERWLKHSYYKIKGPCGRFH